MLKKQQLSHKRQAWPSARKETGRQELQLNSRVQEVTRAKSISLRDGSPALSAGGEAALSVCASVRPGSLRPRLGHLSCSWLFYLQLLLRLFCSRWRVRVLRGCCWTAPRGSAATSCLDSTAFLGKSCVFAALQQGVGLLSPPLKHPHHLRSIIAPSLRSARSPCAPTPARGGEGLGSGSVHRRCGGCKPLPMAG